MSDHAGRTLEAPEAVTPCSEVITVKRCRRAPGKRCVGGGPGVDQLSFACELIDSGGSFGDDVWHCTECCYPGDAYLSLDEST